MAKQEEKSLTSMVMNELNWSDWNWSGPTRRAIGSDFSVEKVLTMLKRVCKELSLKF